MNQHRRARGLVAVRPDPVLTRAATWKARDVVARRYGGHTDPGLGGRPSRTAQQRAQTCGFTAAYALENLAMGYEARSARVVVDAWLTSPGHRANMENPNWRYVGTGSAMSASEDFPGQPLIGVAQMFSASPAPRVGRCSTLSAYVLAGRRVDLAPLTCRADGDPRVVGRPTRGRLDGLTYRASARTGSVELRLRWPDTGVIQPVQIEVLSPRVRATLAPPACSGGVCRVRYALRPPSSGARATLQVQRRAGSRWVHTRSLAVPARGGARTVTLAPGSYRMRIAVSVVAPQRAVHSPWRSARVA